MKRLPFQASGRSIWLSAIAAVLLYGGTAAAAELSVCIDKSSPTAAVDAGLAHAVAAHQGSTLHVHEFDGSGGDEGFGLKDFNKLAKDSCSLVLGFPIDADEHAVPPGLKATRPYGHTGYVLVTARGSKAVTLDQLPEHSVVAVTYQTTPNLYFAGHPNLQADVHLTNDAAFEALEKHQASAAMLWQPTVVHYLAEHHEAGRFSYHALLQPHASFNLVALYDSDHAASAMGFQQTIAAMSSSGELARLLAPYARPGAVMPLHRNTSAMLRLAHRSHRNVHGGAGGKPRHAHSAKHAGLPALFTVAQADSGKQKFAEDCARCHGPAMEGRAGPALKGPNFASAKSDFHVGDIFTILAHNMPASDPGSLTHLDYVDVMAFLLQQNGYPAGKKALLYDEAMRSKVPLVYHEH
ncbi:MAG: transporter substrate-binding domain-containing protein [Rhodanobacter sp.]|nr:transporter substrate-binding domain-containing protein [Rhodanobacter sp.]